MADILSSTVSETPGSNNAASPDGMAEGCAASTVNNTWREGKAAEVRRMHLMNPTITSSGTNTVVVAMTTAETAYYTGGVYRCKLGGTNTGAATLNVGAIGPKDIKNLYGGALIGGELLIGRYAEFVYDGTNMVHIPSTVGPGAVAYANMVGSTGALRGTTYNVSAATDNGAGDFTVNFTVALGGTNYTVVAMSSGDAATDNGFAKVLTTGGKASFSAYTTTTCRIVSQTIEATVANADQLYLGVVVFGGY